MGLSKQARILSERQERIIITHLKSTIAPQRNLVLFLLSIKAGLRAKEIAHIQWKMVFNSDGQIGDCIHLTNDVSKGDQGGRIIPLNQQLKKALITLFQSNPPHHENVPIIISQRKAAFTPQTIVNWFSRLYADLEFNGHSSHSGRRTFVTRAAKNVIRAGGSLRDVQQLVGHSSLQTTQHYIEGDSEAKKKLVELI
ncbi:hypothetical protein AVI51_16755 (plasmid) [Piscirickettsia salmonis]|uniref:Site-specific tyrosine recombinase XerC n=2 Tax=Piscirickettsia salmonis TaxID=1238 RepID=A0A9Q6LPU9_PISSA|nr:site-specific integrase [Piscirickettsia salmonis]ALA24341.1 integrase [Piscirickettsia salmonis]ALA26540.1 integrase [Piscirickettsia salmonis]APS44714.1 hypothetical protein AVI48_10300 [Piscirickettsia salmonis]APS48074.1 hypothetical protein AVI49_10905 [Piscirickettsia salmonis]APS49293.1 hypothetical protein AVI49_16665 [Piscirickettsia salmonis]